MSNNDLVLMDAMLHKMRWHEARQKVLAEDIANADTPGAQSHDLKPLNFKDLLGSSASKLPHGSVSLSRTDNKHLSVGEASSSHVKFKEKTDSTDYESSPSGNSVSLEERLLKMNENMTEHRMITNLYEKNKSLLLLSVKSK